ncbi:uncharacterized protein K489DRAFT_228332 [Dissoconium aciculare CBS 342.82]|uniref:Uncharacterized protein n=1 Tax=Dissoconium aciculare CBS 342.82 TaxID=1314786 RepID=A0A6J3M332_9PEZI|nr:uncharacterized protein K489DRAFT_228332 [Dissoconium aciculare CBS 342.82]KAF1821919.1 hypothetical protein K489DRAFT_228332 [Dissoconium aciculare CBS 342.82]
MRWSIISTLLFVGAVARADSDRSALYTILERMNIVTADMIAANDSINNLQANSAFTVAQVLHIGSLQRRINRDTNATIAKILASPTLSREDSEKLVFESEFHDYLIRSLLDNIVHHKPAFETAVLYVGDLSRTMQSGLREGRGQVDKFARAAQKIVVDEMVIPEDQLLGAWDVAIAAFETCGGTICLSDVSKYRKWVGI